MNSDTFVTSMAQSPHLGRGINTMNSDASDLGMEGNTIHSFESAEPHLGRGISNDFRNFEGAKHHLSKGRKQ